MFDLCFLQLQVDCEHKTPKLDSLQVRKRSTVLVRSWGWLLVGVVWCVLLRSGFSFFLSSLSELEEEDKVELEELVWKWIYLGKSRALCGQCWQVRLEFCSMVLTTLNDDAVISLETVL